eukprot:TRINITY_DN1000_c1_g1_i1.p1 TRINITY_DN1000_c1_g1~~TRINITY_DN1000_c1_g1_i1.p1  ORF type:complete len:843 (-),score=269.40 TRINITY_DN1000_c1_g1_i1:170-2698(-)
MAQEAAPDAESPSRPGSSLLADERAAAGSPGFAAQYSAVAGSSSFAADRRQPRPQSHRFLQKTLAKLHEDNVRLGSSSRHDEDMALPPPTSAASASPRAASRSGLCRDSLTSPGLTATTVCPTPPLLRESSATPDWEAFAASSRPETCTPTLNLAAFPGGTRSLSREGGPAFEPVPEEGSRFEALGPPAPSAASGARAVQAPGMLGKCWIVPHSEVEHWRQIFREEAQQCTQALRAMLDDFNGTQTGRRLEEWREADLKRHERLDDSLRELTSVGKTIQHFVHEFGALDADGHFRGTVQALQNSVDKLAAAQDNMSAVVDQTAERAVKRVFDVWDEEGRQATCHFVNFVDQNRAFLIDQQEQWCQSKDRTNKLFETVQEMVGMIKARYAEQNEFEKKQRETLSRVEGMVDESQRHEEKVEEFLSDMRDTLHEGQKYHATSLRKHMSNLLMGRMDDWSTAHAQESPPLEAVREERSLSKPSAAVSAAAAAAAAEAARRQERKTTTGVTLKAVGASTDSLAGLMSKTQSEQVASISISTTSLDASKYGSNPALRQNSKTLRGASKGAALGHAEEGAPSRQASKTELASALTGEDAVAGGGESIFDLLQGMKAKIAKLEVETMQDVTNWQQMSVKWSAASDQTAAEAKVLREQAEKDGVCIRELELKAKQLAEQFQQTSAELKALEGSVASTALKKIKDIEARGQIMVNRQTGQIDFKAPVDFKQLKPQGNDHPTAEFKELDVAVNALKDVAELSGIFNVPMTVEAHLKGGRQGNAGFWEAQVKNRAEAMKKVLVEKGVDASLLSTNSCYGKTGLNVDALFIKLDRGIFPAGEAKAEQKTPRGKR